MRAPLPHGGEARAFVIARGGGDFNCPCYWGIDHHGRPVALVVDLLICGSFVDDMFEMPFTENLLTLQRPIPQLTEFGFSVQLVRESLHQIEVRSEGEYASFDLVDADGALIASTDRSGHTTSGRSHVQFLACLESLPAKLRLRTRWRRWQHEFARDLPMLG